MRLYEIMLLGFPLWKLLLLTIGGIFAGFINTIAGGGSLLTIPLLIFLGLPSPIANGTNRVAILMQNITGVIRFTNKKALTWDRDNTIKLLSLVIPSIVGAGIGAFIATQLSKEVFDIVICALMILVLITLFLKPKDWDRDTNEIRYQWWRYPVFLLIGVYGGFIQAGVGFLLLSTLVVGMGFNIVRANAVKVLVILVYTVLALVVYILSGQVILVVGLALGLGSMIGSFIGVNSMIKIKPTVLRWIIVIAVLMTVLKLLGVFNFME